MAEFIPISGQKYVNELTTIIQAVTYIGIINLTTSKLHIENRDQAKTREKLATAGDIPFEEDWISARQNQDYSK